MTELLKLTWPKLQIESLEAPPRLQLLIGWTGSPASTSNLINEVALSKEERQRKYDHFLEQSALCVSKYRSSATRSGSDHVPTCAGS